MGTYQAKLLGNRREVALLERSLSCVHLKGIAFLQSQTIENFIFSEQVHMQHICRETWHAAVKESRQPPRSGFQDKACLTYSSRVSRFCNLTAPQNYTLTAPHSQGPEICEPCAWQAELPREDQYRLNRRGMALRELSAPRVPMRVTWKRHRRGSAPMFIVPAEYAPDYY